jgi:8-oxo-dGTP pyrophosphatase MutT (NUDIX family)
LTSDIIPYNNGFVYLIERSDGKGWALPGGFIDYGEEPIEAAIREFNEETLGNKNDIDNIKYLGLFKTNDKRDLNFFSFVFLFEINNLYLKYNDDAINGKWVSINDAINMNLAFRHHNEFLKMIKW